MNFHTLRFNLYLCEMNEQAKLLIHFKHLFSLNRYLESQVFFLNLFNLTDEILVRIYLLTIVTNPKYQNRII